jgi:hypothetical protein
MLLTNTGAITSCSAGSEAAITLTNCTGSNFEAVAS